MAASSPAPRPALTVGGRPSFADRYDAALANLLDVNTVPGRTAEEPARFIRAGGGYEDPWTRDAALNSWGAADVLEPVVARDTLLMVCAPGPEGDLVIRQDDQWWDQLIWLVAAWRLVRATGDRAFLRTAYDVGVATLRVIDADPTRFDREYGLFRGGALMQDGIAGYPTPPFEPGNPSSFVLDHPAARSIMSLSTNVVGVGALRSLARMADALGEPSADLDARADAVAAAIDARLWDPDRGSYGYLVHGSGPEAGRLDRHEETAGIALAVTFGIATGDRARRILEGVHREPFGVVSVWPHFADRFSPERPGRHNAILWPMIMGLHGDAAATVGLPDVLGRTLDDLDRLVDGSDGRFFEVYNARTGDVDGGWQTGTHWDSLPDQTWSATAFLRLIHDGLLGLRPGLDGLRFAPTLPSEFGTVSMSGLRFGSAAVDIEVVGEGGHRVASLDVDDRPVDPAAPALTREATGKHRLRIRMSA